MATLLAMRPRRVSCLYSQAHLSNSDIAAIIAIKNDLQLLDWQGSLALSMLPGGHKRRWWQKPTEELARSRCPLYRRPPRNLTYGAGGTAFASLTNGVRLPNYPDLDQLRSRIAAVNPRISLATVYNNLRLLAEFGLIERHKFRGRPTRYGPAHQVRQGHLIDVTSGRVVPVERNREPSR